MKLSLEQQPVMVLVLLACLVAPLLTGCSGCTCSQTLVRAKPLLPSISVQHIFQKKSEGCGSGPGVCACGCQSMSGCQGMSGCQQHAAMNPLTSQSSLPTSGYNAHPCYYSNSHLYATPPGYISPASTTAAASTTSYTHYPHCQTTYTQSLPLSTMFSESATSSVCPSCGAKRHSERSEEDCSCSREEKDRKSSRRSSSRKSSRRSSSGRRRKCKESEEEEEESVECQRTRTHTFKGCLKLPFFSGSIQIGHKGR